MTPDWQPPSGELPEAGFESRFPGGAAIWDNRFDRWERFLLLAASVCLLALFIVARCLPPSQSGMGTHQSLGLPPCGALVLWGVPCPSCGMTTSWAWFARGDFGRSWVTNPGGFLLAVYVAIMSGWMGISGVMNRWWPVRCEPYLVLALGTIVVVVTLIQWVGRLL
jgi:hypothetical protein